MTDADALSRQFGSVEVSKGQKGKDSKNKELNEKRALGKEKKHVIVKDGKKY
jgi:hypothetical protein